MRLSRYACEMASSEGFDLLGRLFDYHRQSSLRARRLVLAPPMTPDRQQLRRVRKRKVAPADDGEGELAGGTAGRHTPRGTDLHSTVGSIFGCTIGNIVGYLEGRGIPAERAHILRILRAQLLPAAESLRYMSGRDVVHLSRGMASCRIVSAQRTSLPELAGDDCPKIDYKYGNVGTAVGTTATLLAAFGVMATVPNHCRHLIAESALPRIVRIAEAKLQNWKPSTSDWSEEDEDARLAELRALRRVCIGVREAMDECSAQVLAPADAMQLQLEWARISAFPGGERVDAYTHEMLCQKVKSRALFRMACQPMMAPRPVYMTSTRTPVPTNVLPLSEIPEDLLRKRTDRAEDNSDTRSCSAASSSWQTLSSRASSAFSNVSNDSLSGVVGQIQLACNVNGHAMSAMNAST